MKIAVTGASGFVGRHLCDHLISQGHDVLAISRSGKSAAGIKGIKADVVTAEGLPQALQGADAVMHLVGIIAERGPEITFDKVHVQGTQNVLEAAEQAGVKRYIHMSALGASLPSRSRYFSSKAEAEARVEASPLASTILRPSLIFGIGDDFFGRVLKDLVSTAPIIPQIGDGNFPFRPIWVGDVARAFEQALQRESTIGERYDLVGPKEYSFRELLELMRETLGLSKTIVPVPLALMKLAVPMMQVLPNPPITQDQFSMLLSGNTADPSDMRRAFALTMTELEALLPDILAKSNH